ncbi:hypothetical protein DPEC_G00125300 [Dallia pectoralis]|uniref:Uncharacterized protein n=1 Tax=Dallia pectoralis TaxID=75939 RepID=A0ACC2GR40_DALPE|nr:hypothetical protein DPEC_G00125300 [Dallia pectoralis]
MCLPVTPRGSKPSPVQSCQPHIWVQPKRMSDKPHAMTPHPSRYHWNTTHVPHLRPRRSMCRLTQPPPSCRPMMLPHSTIYNTARNTAYTSPRR